MTQHEEKNNLDMDRTRRDLRAGDNLVPSGLPEEQGRAAERLAVMNPSPQTNTQPSEVEKIGLLEERIASLEDELHEARQVPWPEWAKEILKSLQAHGYDPVVDGEVDLGEAFKDYLDGIAQAEEHDKLWMKDVFSVRDGGNSITLHFAEIKTAKAFRNKFAANIVAAAPENQQSPAKIEIGAGQALVTTGTFKGRPAIFIAPAKFGGAPGSSAEHEGRPKDRLLGDEVIFLLPTYEQARQLSDAFCGISDASQKLTQGDDHG